MDLFIKYPIAMGLLSALFITCLLGAAYDTWAAK